MPLLTLTACIFATSAASVASSRAVVKGALGHTALAEPEFIEPVMQALEKALQLGPVWIRDTDFVTRCVRLSMSRRAEPEFVERIASALAEVLEHQGPGSADNVGRFLLHNIGKARTVFVRLAALAFVRASQNKIAAAAAEAVEDLGALARARPKSAGLVVKALVDLSKRSEPSIAEKAVEVLGKLCQQTPELAGQVVQALGQADGSQGGDYRAVEALCKLCQVTPTPKLKMLVVQALEPVVKHGQQAVAERALEVLVKLAKAASEPVVSAVTKALEQAMAHKTESVGKQADRLLRHSVTIIPKSTVIKFESMQRV